MLLSPPGNTTQLDGSSVQQASGYIKVSDGTGTGQINLDGGKIVEVSTLTNHTAQTGDTYALANNGTYGFSALEGLVDELESRLTAVRAGYLDELAAANLPTDIADIPTVAEFNARTLAAAAYFLFGSDEVTTDSASRTASKADVSGLATSGAQTTAQNDLDILTGSDGATLATSQGNYAPSKAGDSMGLSNDAITEAKITDAAWQELIELLFDFDAAATYATADAGSVVKQIGSNATVTIPPRLE